MAWTTPSSTSWTASWRCRCTRTWPPASARFHDGGLRLVTLTNGATRVAERLLGDAGVLDRFERLMSVEDAGIWKPHRRAYEYAAATCGTDLSRMLLVAVHPWDIDGAARAGMSTAWVNRSGGRYPTYTEPASLEVSSLPDLADRLMRP